MKNNVSNDIFNKLNEEFYGGAEFEEERKPLNAEELFDMYCEYEERIPDYIDKWNNVTGTPEAVKRERARLINPAVVDFVNDYEEDIRANLSELSDLMTENNYHVALASILKELGKFE